jgi:hypothetical protein
VKILEWLVPAEVVAVVAAIILAVHLVQAVLAGMA